ncbi:MAG: hypothetical protein ACPGD5_06380 [Salibacteraceae bacterium]
MKLSFLIPFILFFNFELKAQEWYVEYSMGTGLVNMFELYSDDYYEYQPFFIIGGAKYHKPNSYWNYKANFQYIRSKIETVPRTIYKKPLTQNREFYDSLPGVLSHYSTMVLIEHLKNSKKWNFGYDFGIGLTLEELLRSKENKGQREWDYYLSVRVGFITSLKLGEKTRLFAQPMLFWTNPISTFRPENHQMANEDLSLLLSAGISYRFK